MTAPNNRERILPRLIDEEIKESFINYSMSVIVSRALPDVRDGLKPVQRRVLYAMNDLGLTPGRPYKKSATVVGEVLGKYHPHGDSSVYDALVRMVQDFSLRYPLVDGQGNFGCFTGDTKIKLLDGTERTFAELAALPAGEVFHVYSVDAAGRIVDGEGHSSRITKRGARVIELTFDDGSRVRCTPEHRFMLRDGSWKEAQHLTVDDSLMAGHFDYAPVKERTNAQIRVRQRKIAGYAARLLAEVGREGLTPAVFDERRSANWVPTSTRALAYFDSFDELVSVAAVRAVEA